MDQSKLQTKINVKLFSGKNKDFWKWKFHVEVIFELEDGSSGQTASTLHTWGGGRGKRRGPKRGPCTVHGGAAGPYHSSFGCDSTPVPE